jgi:Phosphorylase superfamily
MIASRKWAERNIGSDPITTPTPAAAFSVARAAKTTATPEDFRREIIDFDSEGAEGLAFMSFTTSTGMSRFTDVPWPKGLAPTPDKTARAGKDGALPTADFLVVTWTMDEGHALSRVLTPGKDSKNDYVSYTHNFATLSKKFRNGCPAIELKRLGAYWTGKIGAKTVVFFKSDSHMSQDGPQLPNIDVWTQIISEVKPKLVLTTGTGGGIGKQFEVGDVIVSPVVRFDCIKDFKKEPFHADHYTSNPPNTKYFAKAKTLFKPNTPRLPPDNTRAPEVVNVAPADLSSCVVTTDFFGFDTSDDHYGLKGLGDLSEMGDAVLGLVAKQMGADAPGWLAVRNVSDPQIKAEGTLTQQSAMAAHIYKAFGRWSSVCSAIVCWAIIAGA